MATSFQECLIKCSFFVMGHQQQCCKPNSIC